MAEEGVLGQAWSKQLETIVLELAEAAKLSSGKLLVVGASTSEVQGSLIGTSGTLDTAEQLICGVEAAQQSLGFSVAYQCCEHLNRALVIERALAELLHLEIVSAIPVREAGGSLATIAYSRLTDPCLVAAVQADAAIDIGSTLIGMHVRPVAVPFRPSIRTIGEAFVTAAYARPRLIGGERAVYRRPDREANCDV